MADYGININASDYLYRRPVYYTNPLNQDREDVVVRMVLHSTNFNFSTASLYLDDLRVAEKDNGTRVLRMWVAYLDPIKQYANVYLKLPSLLANQTVTLWVFFGNDAAKIVKEPDKIGFLFYETFDTTPLNSSKWSGTLNKIITQYGYDLGYTSTGLCCSTITNPLFNKTEWIMEAGTYLNGDDSSFFYRTSRSHAFEFSGSENSFIVGYTRQGIVHTITDSTTQHIISDIQCPELYSYQENFISYDTAQDKVCQRSFDRNTFVDADNILYRKVEGDTKISDVVLYGAQYGAGYLGRRPTYISWLVIRSFDVDYRVLVDCKDLYVTESDRTIDYLSLDYQTYGDDITTVLYKHETSFGGDPLLLSDDSTDAPWISGAGATSELEVGVTIDFGVMVDLTSVDLVHYDSDHVKYFGASKLSDNDEDVWGRNFWSCPTASGGWAAIDFGSKRVINSCRITAVDEDLCCCPKEYIFYGSNYDPTTNFTEAQMLYSGIFKKVDFAQQFFFNNKAEYRYYILYVINNYGGANIRIQEWEMYNSGGANKKRISQLKLLPPTYELLYSFPKEISLQASVDMISWDILIPWTLTYSPYKQHYSMYGYWQCYPVTVDVEKGYWVYKLLCRGNWGESSGKISIKKWEMCELAAEQHIHRILDGVSNFIRQIWASENCGIDDVSGIIYATNDRLNYIINNVVFSVSLPQSYNDLNVITGV